MGALTNCTIEPFWLLTFIGTLYTHTLQCIQKVRLKLTNIINFKFNSKTIQILYYGFTLQSIWFDKTTCSNIYRYWYSLPINVHNQNCSMAQLVGRPSSKRETVDSSPTVDKNFSFCNSRFLQISNQPIQLKSTVAPSLCPVLARE